MSTRAADTAGDNGAPDSLDEFAAKVEAADSAIASVEVLADFWDGHARSEHEYQFLLEQFGSTFSDLID